MNPWRLRVKLWGVRGSVPTPYPQNLGHGGNTPCVEVRLSNGEILIFDAGTGIRQLGADLQKEGLENRKISLFLTHFHWDHIHGLPFFAPLFESAHISFHAGADLSMLKTAIAGQMMKPYFPIDFKTVSSRCDFVELGDEDFRIGDVLVRPFPVHHPQGAFGYRVESGGATVVYIPDREPGNRQLDSVLREYAQGADVLIHDAQYTREEYRRFRGWGHSTWDEAAQIARDCGVKQLILFHHDPEHDDMTLARIENDARQSFENTSTAREGWVATL